MPTFTTIALDRLLEPGASKSVDKTLPKPKPAPNSKGASNSTLERRNSTSVVDKKVQRPQIKPALYTTPETTPLPDSPSSFPPSPYIINHKRRGPRLLKSFSEDDVSSRQKMNDKENVSGRVKSLDSNDVKLNEGVSISFDMPTPHKDGHKNDGQDCDSSSNVDQNGSVNGYHGPTSVQFEIRNGNHESSVMSNGVEKNNSLKFVVANLEINVEKENFFDPQDSMSATSYTDGEDNGGERSMKLSTPMGEFYDAWEELSSESGQQASISDIETELREMRLSLLMELEKRKQTEEELNNLRGQWKKLREQLLLVGLTLPSDPTVATEREQLNDPAEDLCQQVYLARFVSDSIGRGLARAEVEVEMETRLEAKNFEMARLLDRLHYYEAVNHEMSQRNQEAVDLARRERLRRKRRQRWIWGSVAAAITLGTTVLAWSYLPSGKDSSSSNHSKATEHDDATD